AWKTQPRPVLPKPFTRLSSELTENDINPYSKDKDSLLEIFRKADKRYWAPPSTEPVLYFPGYDGGAEWGGAGADPDDGIMYVNSNETPWILKVEKNDTTGSISQGKNLFLTYCAACHNKDLSGYPASGYPSLVNITGKMHEDVISRLITSGKGRMVGFPQLSNNEKHAIIEFIKGGDKKEIVSEETSSVAPDLYRHGGYHKFLDSDRLPGISPPWGTLNAIDLNSGEFLWSIPFGETPSLKAQGHPTTGT